MVITLTKITISYPYYRTCHPNNFSG